MHDKCLHRVHCSLYAVVALMIVALLLDGCASALRYSSTVNFPWSESTPSESLTVGQRWQGIASYYDDRFHSHLTASGERFDQEDLTAAHRWLPFGTKVRVRNLRNGRITIVRINDRGPYVAGRIIDLSRRAAELLDMLADGTTEVEIVVVELQR